MPFIEFAEAVCHNGCARYDMAVTAALRSNEHHLKGGSSLVQPELIEAAIRLGRRDLAELAYDRLSGLMELASSKWADGVDARSRALLQSRPLMPKRHTTLRSVTSSKRQFKPTSRARSCCTANGFDASAAAATRGNSCRQRMTRSGRWERQPSQTVPPASSSPRADAPQAAERRCGTISPLKKGRSHDSRATGFRTPPSARNCSSAHGQSSITSTRCSRSLKSRHEASLSMLCLSCSTPTRDETLGCDAHHLPGDLTGPHSYEVLVRSPRSRRVRSPERRHLPAAPGRASRNLRGVCLRHGVLRQFRDEHP